jgi:hypothetical protein
MDLKVGSISWIVARGSMIVDEEKSLANEKL